jgi:hypothetical protein
VGETCGLDDSLVYIGEGQGIIGILLENLFYRGWCNIEKGLLRREFCNLLKMSDLALLQKMKFPSVAPSTMLLPRPRLRPSLFFNSLFNPLSFYPRPLQSVSLFPFLTRSKYTINQILRGGRIPPKHKRTQKPEGPDLKQNPFKKAVVQKVYNVNPKVQSRLKMH